MFYGASCSELPDRATKANVLNRVAEISDRNSTQWSDSMQCLLEGHVLASARPDRAAPNFASLAHKKITWAEPKVLLLFRTYAYFEDFAEIHSPPLHVGIAHIGYEVAASFLTAVE